MFFASWDGRKGSEGAAPAGIQVQFTLGLSIALWGGREVQELQEFEYILPGVVHCLMGW